MGEMKEKKKGIITIGDLPPTLFSSWVHSKKSKRSGVTVVYRNADLPGEKKRQRIKFVGEKKFDYSLTYRWIDSTDVVQQRQGEGADNKKYKSKRLLGFLSPVSARADNGTKGGPSASQHLSAGSSSCISKGYILQEEMEKSKNFIIQSLFFSLFFFIPSRLLSPSRCIFFLRERVEQKKTDDTGWRSWWDVLSRMFFFLLLLLSLS